MEVELAVKIIELYEWVICRLWLVPGGYRVYCLVVSAPKKGNIGLLFWNVVVHCKRILRKRSKRITYKYIIYTYASSPKIEPPRLGEKPRHSSQHWGNHRGCLRGEALGGTAAGVGSGSWSGSAWGKGEMSGRTLQLGESII